MQLDDIRQAINEYSVAAARAIEAGFDGIQIHAASGYLPDQFLRSGSNERQDLYGGSARNRARFLQEIVAATAQTIGEERVSVRLSTGNPYNDMFDSQPAVTFGTAARVLADFRLSYLEVVEPIPGHFMAGTGEPVLPAMRAAFPGIMVVNGGYTRELADRAISSGAVDAVAFGIPFLCNPDAVSRFRDNSPLNAPDPSTFYTPGEPGYLDYPTLQQAGGVAKGDYRVLSLDEAKKH
jgi:N-ethylmaleimide reductase